MLENEIKPVLLVLPFERDSTAEMQSADGTRPGLDYLDMAQACDAKLIDYTEARRSAGWIGRLLEKFAGPNLMLAWACFKLRYDYKVIVTYGEQVGILLAFLCKLARCRQFRHLMIIHVLSVRKKMIFFDLFGIQRYIDMFIVLSSWQKHFVEERWKVPPERVVFTPFTVDAGFFSPERVLPRPRRMICSVGLEFRDYPTLLRAVHGLDVEVEVVAGSLWSKRKDTTAGQEIPPNVTLHRYSWTELRQMYADSCFVVVPLYNVNYQAGITTILEAMAMERAVICSRIPGQTDVVEHEKTGLYVPTGDSEALRTAIEHLLNNPQEAERMGKAGRNKVEVELSLECYSARVHSYVHQALIGSDASRLDQVGPKGY